MWRRLTDLYRTCPRRCPCRRGTMLKNVAEASKQSYEPMKMFDDPKILHYGPAAAAHAARWTTRLYGMTRIVLNPGTKRANLKGLINELKESMREGRYYEALPIFFDAQRAYDAYHDGVKPNRGSVEYNAVEHLFTNIIPQIQACRSRGPFCKGLVLSWRGPSRTACGSSNSSPSRRLRISAASSTIPASYWAVRGPATHNWLPSELPVSWPIIEQRCRKSRDRGCQNL